MRIHNIRFGLATNSSSSHSLIFAPGARDSGVSSAEFGWEFFTAASEEAKRAYAAVTLRSNMRDPENQEVAATVREWAGANVGEDGYIDHQSVYSLPMSWDGAAPDKAFFGEFLAFMLKPSLVVLGGNDNGDHEHPLDDGRSFALPLAREGGNVWVARKDPLGYWAVFNRESGARIRFSFDDLSATPQKASAPELVDVKITDYCPYGCAWCYQGSTTEGKHADPQWLSYLAWALGNLRVFEVALGGGEPTLHPQFETILRNFRQAGVVPNFTTKSLAWLRDTDRCKAILSSAGAFAFSVENAGDVKALAGTMREAGVEPSVGSVQYVMGTTYLAELEAILHAAADARLRVTLLGYKTTGRGSDVTPQNYDGWLDTVRRVREKKWVSIAIDTVLASAYEAQITAAGVPRYLFTTKEGKFSAYIDAVEQRMGPSSFCEPGLMRPVRAKPESVRGVFAQF